MTTHEHRQPTHREDLERTLVGGIACFIGEDPEKAKAIADGIKTLLDGLAPAMPQPASIAALPVIDPGPDSLERDMERAHKIQDEALLAGATGREDMRLLCGAASFTVPIEQEIQTNANVAPRVTLEEMSGIFDSANNGKFRVPMQDGALASVSFWWSDFRNKLEAMISDDCHGLRVFQLRRIDADSPLELTRQEVCDGMAEGLTKLVEGYALKEKMNG